VDNLQAIQQKYKAVAPVLNERGRRIWAASEAAVLGRGGVTTVARATGLARNTIYEGLRELEQPAEERRTAVDEHSRRPGGGRKRLSDTTPELREALQSLVEPTTRGDPMSPLRWTCLSVSELAKALKKKGIAAGRDTVARLLHEMEYSLRGNRKTNEGKSQHPDRDLQFRYINRRTRKFQADGMPVISVDTKKKELVGNFKNSGREWRPKGRPENVNVHDFRDDTIGPLGGKAIPYGVYDLSANAGWVSVGVDHDTPDFAAQSIRTWWTHMGRREYPSAGKLLIMADGGGSNGYRIRAWKVALQHLARDTGLEISVCHFPPGTSKWNKIEHRMFCHITRNWRGRPLISHEVIVNLIGHTRTETGLKVKTKAKLDRRKYPTGIKVSDQQLIQVNITRSKFHGEWNYTIRPV
jgi:transposase